MSHNVGRVVTVPAVRVGPDSGMAPGAPGVWEFQFNPQLDLNGNTPLFVILHLTGMDLPGTSKVQVELGYGRDEFTSLSGSDVWTRPIDPAPGPIVVRYLGPGPTGGVSLGQYGSGEPWTTTYPANQAWQNSVTNADVFLRTSPYGEPTYQPWLECGGTFDWQNAACAAAQSVEEQTAGAVCMLIMAHVEGGQTLLSTCSGTLIDTNLVLTARHCATDPNGLDIASGSVVFNYQTTCGGTTPGNYAPGFCKIRRAVAAGGTPQNWNQVTNGDWLILEIDPVPVGIAPRPMRHTLPAANEQVFIVHHPNGTVKKIQAGTLASGDVTNVNGFDYAGGSSGSAMFDANGAVIGAALSSGNGGYYQCQTGYTPAWAVLDALATPQAPLSPFDVMLVMDRSGSMSDIGTSGNTKMQEAHDAASLFVQLIRVGSGDRLGMVSFSTTASLDNGLGNVNPGHKHALVGNAPYTSGTVGALTPGGWTSIGGGLDTAMSELNPPGTNTRAILLMTDGMQNTPPMVEDVEGALGNSRLFAVGFGNDAELDSQLLSRITADHNGIYTRAQDGLDLKKFFGLCFGNIFESGALMDPYLTLPGGAKEGKELRFGVCDEDKITVVVGWERDTDALEAELATPGGTVIAAGSSGLVSDTGLTWAFLRVSLPYAGERSGTWRASVRRAGRRKSETTTRYFITVLADGGPAMRPLLPLRRLYTGDRVNPAVALHYPNGAAVEADVLVTVERPAASLGELVAKAGLKDVKAEEDRPSSFAATALRLRKRSRGGPIQTDTAKIELYDDGVHEDGAMEPDGVYANPTEKLLRYEGTYTFHAVAEYGDGCRGRREAVWSVHVEPGIDSGRTKSRFVGGIARRKTSVFGTVAVTPRDRYGSLVGPGRANRFKVSGGQDTTVTGPVRDQGDGSYLVPVEWRTGAKPSLVIAQPDRDPGVVAPIAPAAGRRSTSRAKTASPPKQVPRRGGKTR